MLIRRHLIVVLPDGPLTEAIEARRARWDPTMAALVPAHTTVVYPEHVTDVPRLLERMRSRAQQLRSFPLDLRGVERDADGGVFVRASDRTGALTALRRELTAPPFVAAEHPFHVTIVHPRSPDRGAEAYAELAADPISGSVPVSAISFTESTPDTFSVSERFELAPPRSQVVAAVLRRGDRVLLGHRTPHRASFPDVWDLPGGHVEPGEHAAESLAREIREELGIELSPIPDGPAVVLSDDELDVDLSIWFVDDWDGEPVNAAPEEHDAIEWCRATDSTRRPLAHDAYLSVLAESRAHRS